ncbi:MAG: hypothetical protein ACHREM_08995 [Polyangiales bacterium]
MADTDDTTSTEQTDLIVRGLARVAARAEVHALLGILIPFDQVLQAIESKTLMRLVLPVPRAHYVEVARAIRAHVRREVMAELDAKIEEICADVNPASDAQLAVALGKFVDFIEAEAEAPAGIAPADVPPITGSAS